VRCAQCGGRGKVLVDVPDEQDEKAQKKGQKDQSE